MPTPWQNLYPGEKKPVVTTNQGYHVSLPDHPRAYARENQHTAYLEDQDSNRLYMWVHEIAMSFQLSGSTAQSHQYRAFYPRNFVAPVVTLTGQCASQEAYGDLCEFIRESQRKSLRWDNSDARMNSVHLHIPSGGEPNTGHFHEGHALNGHIRSIRRQTTRWVNAPEFTFEFMVATASAGIYETHSSDPSAAKNAIGKIIAPQGQQIYDQTRGTGADVVDWVHDPDVGNGVAGYSNGSTSGRGD